MQNAPGAGGLNNANSIYNVANKDGLSLGQVQNTVPFEPFYGNSNARFDATKMNWLGSPGKETAVLLIWHTVPVNSLAEAKSRGLVLGATGAASTPAFYGRVINAVFGVPIKLIAGYKSQNESFLAMERGENEGYSSTFWSSLKLTKPDWIVEHKVKLLLQYGGEAAPDLKDVPYAMDILQGHADRDLMQIASAPLALGRPLFAPPGVPTERVTALREAIAATYRDPEYLGDCTQQHLECTNPASASDLASLIQKAYAASVGSPAAPAGHQSQRQINAKYAPCRVIAPRQSDGDFQAGARWNIRARNEKSGSCACPSGSLCWQLRRVARLLMMSITAKR